MAFLLKFLILFLSFQQVFGKSMYQKQQDKKRQELELVRARNEALELQEELNLRNFCKSEHHYYEEKCISLRAKDSFRAYCETHYTESKCIEQFGTLHHGWLEISLPILIMAAIFITPIVMHCMIA